MKHWKNLLGFLHLIVKKTALPGLKVRLIRFPLRRPSAVERRQTSPFCDSQTFKCRKVVSHRQGSEWPFTQPPRILSLNEFIRENGRRVDRIP